MPENTPQVPAGAGTSAATSVQPGPNPTNPAMAAPAVGAAVPSATPGATPGATGATPGAAGSQGGGNLNAYSGSEEGENLYTKIAQITPLEKIDPIIMNTGETFKIACFFVNKFELDKNKIIFLKYGKDIMNFTIENNLYNYGSRCSALINDQLGLISGILESQLNFYFVISIFNSLDSSTSDGKEIESGILYQPYIFEINSFELASDDHEPQKMFNISFSDIISSTLNRVSYGNLLLEQPSFPNLSNFGDVYRGIIDYAALCINLLHDKNYYIPRDLILGGPINDQLNPIIKDIVLKGVTIDTSLYSLLNRVYNMAAREIEAPESFSKKAEVKGMILTPLFLQDEWEDFKARYRLYYKDHDDDDMSEEINYGEGDNASIKAIMFKRGLYLKHLQMPFQLAFCEEEPMIYETLNPKKNQQGAVAEEEEKFNPLNGYTVTEIEDAVELPFDGNMGGLLWKNLSLMSDGASGSSNALIYFNWIFEYYKHAYLNFEENFIKKEFNREAVPPVDPYFLRLERLNLTGGDKEKFAKINSFTARLRSTDPIKEAFWHVGRSIKSYIFLNALFGFKIRGNLLRHPGEIMKINYNSGEAEPEFSSQNVALGGGDALENGYVLAFTTKIAHCFNGNTYKDIISATKICSVSEPGLTQTAPEETNGNNSNSNSNSQNSGQNKPTTLPKPTLTTPATPSTPTPTPTVPVAPQN